MRSWRFVLACGGLAAIVALLIATSLSDSPNASANPAGGFVAIAGGEEHTCAITDQDTVKCWGFNTGGQLGNELWDIDTVQTFPADTAELAGPATAIAAGFHHTCVIIESGAVQCWGENTDGQVGVDASESEPSPLVVDGLRGEPVALTGGLDHTCALGADGTVECWGGNRYGQLGRQASFCGLYSRCVNEPGPVDGLSEAVAVAAGSYHTCAALASGRVRCWGYNAAGQLGDGSALDRVRPIDVNGIQDVVALAAGSSHTCAQTSQGAVWCWGLRYGNVPIALPDLPSGVVQIAARQSHTCALLASATVRCWGDNGFGQLGDGQRCGGSCLTPVNVLDLPSDVLGLGLGVVHTCAVLRTGGAKCWGNNFRGQLGSGEYGLDRFSAVPVDVVEAEVKPTPTPTPCPPEGCPTPTPRPAPPQTGLDFSIAIDADGNGLFDCGSAAGQVDVCTIEPGPLFRAVVTLHALPPGVQSYSGFDVIIAFAGVVSEQKSDILWPDCGFPATFFDTDSLAFGCAAPVGAIRSSSYVGPIGETLFTCARPGSVTLVHGPGRTDFVQDVGSVFHERPSGGEQLIINCGEAKAGDVDCDVAVSSVDAALMLQQHVALLDYLGCPQHSDVNLDRELNSVDAALTLQYTAGIIDALPAVAGR